MNTMSRSFAAMRGTLVAATLAMTVGMARIGEPSHCCGASIRPSDISRKFSTP